MPLLSPANNFEMKLAKWFSVQKNACQNLALTKSCGILHTEKTTFSLTLSCKGRIATLRSSQRWERRSGKGFPQVRSPRPISLVGRGDVMLLMGEK